MAVVRIEGINHVQVSVPVGSEDIVRRFYCGVLGLAEVPKPEALRARGGLWLAAGAGMLHFGAEDVADRAASKRHVAFDVTDLAAARRTLEAAGVAVVEGIQIPGYARFECRDPFGNRLEFLERLTPRGSSGPS
jgi:catechol 2,3-dioxygenase-like lactoylglutathione lyase family enzyme